MIINAFVMQQRVGLAAYMTIEFEPTVELFGELSKLFQHTK
jgi:hypothetical protein